MTFVPSIRTHESEEIDGRHGTSSRRLSFSVDAFAWNMCLHSLIGGPRFLDKWVP
jgi:hypothetical protein